GPAPGRPARRWSPRCLPRLPAGEKAAKLLVPAGVLPYHLYGSRSPQSSAFHAGCRSGLPPPGAGPAPAQQAAAPAFPDSTAGPTREQGVSARKESAMPSTADQANQDMVDRLIAQGALWSPRLIAAFR